MSNVSIEFTSSIDEVDAADWDSLCAGRSFVSHRWLRLVESVLLDYEPSYILARRDGRLEAAMVGSIARHFTDRSLERGLGWVLSALPLMRCIVPLSNRPGLLVAPREDATEVLPELLAAVRRQALRRRALFISYADFVPGDRIWAALRDAGFHQRGRQTNIILPITWTSTSEYQAALRAPDRRKMGNVERRAQREGIQVAELSSPLEQAGLLRRLIAAVFAHHGNEEMYVPNLLERASAVLANDFHVFGAWHSGDTVGCICALRDGDALILKWMGLDYPRTWGTATYRMLLLATTRLAIELGVRELIFGPTAWETKEDFGALPEVRFNAIAVTPPAPAWLVRAAVQFIARRTASGKSLEAKTLERSVA